jgi:hypothetical protein
VSYHGSIGQINNDRKWANRALEDGYRKRISYTLDQAASQSRTEGKRWVPLSGEWPFCNTSFELKGDELKIHLSCVRKMIPHFDAAEHLPFPKSFRLYLQQMEALEQTVPVNEYRLFT